MEEPRLCRMMKLGSVNSSDQTELTFKSGYGQVTTQGNGTKSRIYVDCCYHRRSIETIA